ncbi:CROL alpha [Colletotrichum tofieldiae]|uniref:CROL alpha n=1 Tax=Colletotrichum tofieldiae TaxID=708197 RepID=A0A161WAZ6_9PEZI|nr:CROL alpha [Colletotrichum tofieldiae]
MVMPPGFVPLRQHYHTRFFRDSYTSTQPDFHSPLQRTATSTPVTMSDNITWTSDFDRFLAGMDAPEHAADMSFLDLLDPTGYYDFDHVDGGALGAAEPLDPQTNVHPITARVGKLHSICVEDETTYPPLSGAEDGSARIPLMVDTPSFSDPRMSLPFTTASEHTSERKGFTCAECNKNWIYEPDLSWHVRILGHKAFVCSVPGCKDGFIRKTERDAHQRRPHLEDHGRVQLDHPLTCVECKVKFRYNSKLQEHAIEAQHSPYSCVCGKTFARLDVLNRHLDSLGTGLPKFPCQFCKRHRGKDGFRRRDHLLQHVRGYHKFEAEGKIDDILPSRRGKHLAPPVCSYRGCPQYRDDSFSKLGPDEQQRTKPFASQSEYTKHMKTVHSFTPFPCTVLGCNKTGSKGYVREKDLVNHKKKEHPDTASYVPEKRDTRIACRYPNCQARLHSNSMKYHMAIHPPI